MHLSPPMPCVWAACCPPTNPFPNCTREDSPKALTCPTTHLRGQRAALPRGLLFAFRPRTSHLVNPARARECHRQVHATRHLQRTSGTQKGSTAVARVQKQRGSVFTEGSRKEYRPQAEMPPELPTGSSQLPLQSLGAHSRPAYLLTLHHLLPSSCPECGSHQNKATTTAPPQHNYQPTSPASPPAPPTPPARVWAAGGPPYPQCPGIPGDGRASLAWAAWVPAGTSHTVLVRTGQDVAHVVLAFCVRPHVRAKCAVGWWHKPCTTSPQSTLMWVRAAVIGRWHMPCTTSAQPTLV